MKNALKVGLMVAMIFLVSPLFSEGTAEDQGKKLVLAVEGDWDYNSDESIVDWYYADLIVKKFVEDTGIEVSIIPVKSDDNTTARLDAMIQAGRSPHVYTDYAGRVGLLAKRDMGLPLNKYLSKSITDMYFESYREIFTDDGDLYALPVSSWAQGGHVNLTALELVSMESVMNKGYITYDEVYEAAKALKKIDPDYYATSVFANQSGGDYWMYVFWLSGHGAKIYNADGSIGLNSPEGIEALMLMKKWYDEDLIPFGAAGLGPGDFIGSIGTGKLVAWSYGLGSTDREVTDADGNVISTWVDIHTTAPRKVGIEKVPMATGPDAVMAFNIGTERAKASAAKLVAHIGSPWAQQWRIDNQGRFPSMTGVTPSAIDNPNFGIMVKQLADNGVIDMGIGTPGYQEMRTEWFVMLQAILTDELTVKEALDRFEENGTEIINRPR